MQRDAIRNGMELLEADGYNKLVASKHYLRDDEWTAVAVKVDDQGLRDTRDDIASRRASSLMGCLESLAAEAMDLIATREEARDA